MVEVIVTAGHLREHVASAFSKEEKKAEEKTTYREIVISNKNKRKRLKEYGIA